MKLTFLSRHLSHRTVLSAIGAMLVTLNVLAADIPVKREMRSAWVATVWRLDWPKTVVTQTGNEAQIAAQKNEMTQLLDSLAINNFNAVNFQIRSRSDAMYRSSYEPWSSDLVGERGMDPGWDPLQFVVEECHKRGLECHAWVNPYRFESVTGQWDGTPLNLRDTNPEMILDVNGASILNPSMAETTDWIVKVIGEVVSQYDIDGVLFDDYFYLSGTPTGDSGDGKQYQKYLEEGGRLSQGDWRRENVNAMVRAVYKMISEKKPYVRFGISPAGIACTNPAVASKYGISACPTGSDWQYNDIYSDPIAWLNDRSIDYISPQIYWTIGYSTDYDKAAKWWSETAAHFGRHFYSSHSISSLTATSKAPDMNADFGASGPNNTSFAEFQNEIRLNRQYSLDGAPGSIFYSCKYIYSTAKLFGHSLRRTVFNTKALLPEPTWKPSESKGVQREFFREGDTLKWSALCGCGRFTLYAIPSEEALAKFDCDPEYLVQVVYGNSYEIPEQLRDAYAWAVCVYDRYGYEWSPTILGAEKKTLGAPELLYPAAGELVEAPFDLRWTAVDGADSYNVEIIDTDGHLHSSVRTTATELSTEELQSLPAGKEVYWRVKALGASCLDGASAYRALTADRLRLTAPADGTTETSLTPTVEWSAQRDGKLQIALSGLFSEIFFEQEVDGSKAMIPAHTLAGGSTYYVRLCYSRNGCEMATEPVRFATAEAEQLPSALAFPREGDKFWNHQTAVVAKLHGPEGVEVQIDNNSKFSNRSLFTWSSRIGTWETPAFSSIKIQSKNLKEGTTYYFRTRATYRLSDGSSKVTAWSDPVSAVFGGEFDGVEAIEADAVGVDPVIYYNLQGIRVDNPAEGGIYIRVDAAGSAKVKL